MLADTPKEAMLRMAEHRKLSSKINYHVLDDLFSDDPAPDAEEAAGAGAVTGRMLLSYLTCHVASMAA